MVFTPPIAPCFDLHSDVSSAVGTKLISADKVFSLGKSCELITVYQRMSSLAQGTVIPFFELAT